MKRILFSVMIGLFSYVCVHAEEKIKETENKWNIEDNRSLSDAPQVSLSNGILFISSYNKISNLSIGIQSMAGEMLVEQSDITLSAGQCYSIDINDLPSGEYLLFLQAGSNYAIYSVTK